MQFRYKFLLAFAFSALLCVSMMPQAVRADGGEVDPESAPVVVDDVVGEREGTDATVVDKEDERIKLDGLSGAEVKLLRDQAEKFEFQASNQRLMQLIINSLYKNKEIFLRELVSNASDAIDKIRMMSLTNPELAGTLGELGIKVKADKDANVLHIIDTGVGMTKKELEANLGTIAKSGTSEFLDKLQGSSSEDASNLIGQFGVGFYSAFLVADTVVVTTKSNDDDKQYIWESDAHSFTIVEDPRGNTLARGTQISLFLKPEAKEFLEQTKIEELLHKYSEFIQYPLAVWSSTTETVEEPIEEDLTAEETEKKADENDEEAKVEEEQEDSKPKTKSVEKTTWDYKVVNENKPIWTRSPKDVTDDEYNRFYKDFTKDTNDPIARTHFSAEGEITFRAILYIPAEAQSEHLQNFYKKTKNVKMYVRRVFITDDFEDMLPKYLNFIVGLVDSDDLPLNVSRETLQQNKLLKVIQKKLVRKAIEMLKNLATNDSETYDKIYKEFSVHIKMGTIEDQANKSRLSKLLRFATSNDSEKMTSLAEYVERMKDKQDKIYYMAGPTREEVEASPFVERLLKKGYEVLYLVDPIDEYLMQSLTEFESKGFQSVAKEGLTFGDETEAHKELAKQQEEKYQPLLDWLKETLGEYISKATVSNRLAESPCALVAPSFGISGNMERIMNSQAMGNKKDPMSSFYKTQKKTLELNPGHPLVAKLLERIADGGEDAKTDESNKDLALVLYDTAVLRAGFALRDSAQFAGRIERMLRISVGVDVNAPVEEMPEPEVTDDGDEEDDDDAEEEDDAEEDDDVVEDASESDEPVHEDL